MVILNTCHIRDRAAEKVFSELGRLRVMKHAREARGGRMILAVAGCVAQAEGAEIVAPRALRRHRARAADLPPPARAGRPRGPRRRHRHRDRLSRPRTEVRPPARCRRTPQGVVRLPDHPGGLRQVLLVLRRPLHPRRREPAVRWQHSSRRRAASQAQGARRDHAARPERQRLARPGIAAGRPSTLARLIRAVADIPGIAAHPLHHQPPEGHGRRPRSPPTADIARADAVPAPAGAVRLGPHARHAMNRRHTAAAYLRHRRPPPRRPPRHGASRRTSSSATPARPKPTTTPPWPSCEAVGFAQAFSFKYSAAPRHARQPVRPTLQVPEPVKDRPPARVAVPAPVARPRVSTPACVGLDVPVLFTHRRPPPRPGGRPGPVDATRPHAGRCRPDRHRRPRVTDPRRPHQLSRRNPNAKELACA